MASREDAKKDAELALQQTTSSPGDSGCQPGRMVAMSISDMPGSRPKSLKYKEHLTTLMVSLVSALGSVGLGTVLGYTSPAIPDLNTHRNVFHLDEVEIAWVVSVASIGGLIGGPLGGFFLDKFGRKMTLMFTSVPFVFGWGSMAAAPNVYCMLLGRLLTGLAAGVMDVAVPIYISEIAASSVRGFMGSCHELATNFGFLFVFTFGIFLHWNWLAVACMVVPLLLMAFMIPMPESPRWLLMKGRKTECRDVLQWLRGEADITFEMAEMEENLRQQTSSKMQWKEFRQPHLYKPLIVVVGLMFFQQFSGYGVILEYLVHILSSTGSLWDPYVQTAVIGAVGFISNLLSALVVDHAGRRVMLAVSSLIMALSLAGLASFFSVKYYAPSFDYTFITWLPTASLMMYNFGVALGYGPVPFYMASELFPLKARGLAGGIGISSLWIFTFVTSLAFPHLLILLHDDGLYWILTAFAILGIVFAMTIVPETKGKSLEEIEMKFRSK